MKKCVYVSAAILSALMLSGCGEEEVKTVDWWTDHPEERQPFVEECRNDNQNELSANCQNAIEAETKSQIVGDKEEVNSPSIR